MTIQISEDGSQIVIRVNGRFGFDSYREFRSAYRHTDGSSRQYRVDLRDTEYLDSSALGMLLLLNQHAGGARERVILARPRGEVRRLLELAGFPSIFTIDCDGTATATGKSRERGQEFRGGEVAQ